ncbi:MAG: alpha-hydroxy-acid oxidizing protein [Anaerovoracaceae bacterium]|nr:alpha-hydroxy-acid oxidizing protein [Bacillota bacterium]MDD7734499.1 alpha-hydroxy-acid oxidizing protein [Bacillota bacterium]MDY5906978.1 alpha-hydroxy-acid oxidizing protein [Anaerovoracaceae bacterium]
MTYDELLENARKYLGPHCKGCAVCNGVACRNTMPGPGAKGTGDNAIRNYSRWRDIRINMDTLTDVRSADTSVEIFGRSFKYPIFAGPVGAVKMHYSDRYDDASYNNILVSACAEAGIAAFTGDGTDPMVMKHACSAIKNSSGAGIPTVKPWNMETIKEKLALVRSSKAFACAMDIDGAGLPFLKNMDPPAGNKSTDELHAVAEEAGVPFIVKGIMTVKGAVKAVEAGASGIIVSNHGGRVLDQCPATAEVLAEIADAVRGKITIFVDGGIRSGTDVFKALAMGADAVVIARPYVTAVYGGGAEGVHLYTEKIGEELRDAMLMCGAASLKDIDRSMVRLPL